MVKTVSLKKNYEFQRVYKKGRFFVGKFMILYVFANNLSKDRLGITVSKKIGKSVVRNRIKRLVKENYRLFEDFVKNGYDLVVVTRSFEVVPTFADIRKEMKFLLKKLKIFEQEKWDCSK